MLKLTTDKHEASRGLSATAELLVLRRWYAHGMITATWRFLRFGAFLIAERRPRSNVIGSTWITYMLKTARTHCCRAGDDGRS